MIERLFVVLILFSSACTQTGSSISKNNEDSITGALETRVKDKVDKLQFDQTQYYLDSIHNWIMSTSRPQIISTWYRLKGAVFLGVDDLDSAKKYLHVSHDIDNRKSFFYKGLIRSKKILAQLFMKEERLDSAVIYAKEAFELAKKNDSTEVAEISILLGGIYKSVGDSLNIKKYLNEGLKYAARSESISLLNNMAYYYFETGNLDSAIYYFELIRGDSLLSSKQKALTVATMGSIYMAKDDFKSGLFYSLHALDMCRENNIPPNSTLFNNISLAYYNQRDLYTANRYADTAIRYAKQEGDYQLVSDLFTGLGNNFYIMTKPGKAYQYMDSAQFYHLKHDSIFSLKVVKEIEAKFDVKLRDAKIKSLAHENHANSKIRNQQKIIIIVLIIAIVLFLSLGILLWKRRIAQLTIRDSEIRNDLLRNQITPHFVFNSLSVIQTDIYSGNREKLAQYLGNFARLLRLSLENVREKLVPLQDELDQVQSYLEIQKTYVKNKFEYTIELTNVNSEEVLIPPMLIQPFVENSIIHGISSLSIKGEIFIQIRKAEDILFITIEDNGIGLSSAKNKKKSLATTITGERLSILKKQTGKPASVTVINKQEGYKENGVRVVIRIPFIKEG